MSNFPYYYDEDSMKKALKSSFGGSYELMFAHCNKSVDKSKRSFFLKGCINNDFILWSVNSACRL
jgi:hypothetical protein